MKARKIEVIKTPITSSFDVITSIYIEESHQKIEIPVKTGILHIAIEGYNKLPAEK